MTLIGKLITPDGKPLHKSLKVSRSQKQSVNQADYMKVLKRLEIVSTAPSSEMSQSDTELDLENSVQVIQEFIHKS